ncbi:four-helix bundle copper-binding protein [Streptomyces sp. NPDC058534]|uniref:four-helix bundle copper-binding protein n=1 Tax=Streptomyces sp. NPDC058534 TaxID=3346541 RepID=UPI0036468C6C
MIRPVELPSSSLAFASVSEPAAAMSDSVADGVGLGAALSLGLSLGLGLGLSGSAPGAVPMVGVLTKCIRTDMDCADVCDATPSVLSRHTGYDANITRAVPQACATVCKACTDECAAHADMHEHGRVCADACRRCEQACNELLAGLG